LGSEIFQAKVDNYLNGNILGIGEFERQFLVGRKFGMWFRI